MILTRVHANYWAERRGPAALRQYAQKTSIDDVVNAHVPKLKRAHDTEPHTTVSLLRSMRKRGEDIGFILERAAWGIPGERVPDEIFGWQRIDRRIAFCRRWAAKILKGRQP
jgi:hypothetical protein